MFSIMTGVRAVMGTKPDGTFAPLLGADGKLAAGAAGLVAAASFTPAAAAYGAGTIMGASQHILFTDRDGNAAPANALVRILSSELKIKVAAVPSGQTSYRLKNYSVTQPSAQADQATWTNSADDFDVRLPEIPLGTPVVVGGYLIIDQQYVDVDIQLDAAGGFWSRLLTDGAHTAAAVARQTRFKAVVF